MEASKQSDSGGVKTEAKHPAVSIIFIRCKGKPLRHYRS